MIALIVFFCIVVVSLFVFVAVTQFSAQETETGEDSGAKRRRILSSPSASNLQMTENNFDENVLDDGESSDDSDTYITEEEKNSDGIIWKQPPSGLIPDEVGNLIIQSHDRRNKPEQNNRMPSGQESTENPPDMLIEDNNDQHIPLSSALQVKEIINPASPSNGQESKQDESHEIAKDNLLAEENTFPKSSDNSNHASQLNEHKQNQNKRTENEENPLDNSASNTAHSLQSNRAETRLSVETEKEETPLENGVPNTDPVIESNEVETKPGVETVNERTDDSAGNTDPALQLNDAETTPDVQTEKEVTPLDNGVSNTDRVVESNEVKTKPGVETVNERTDDSAGNTDPALQPKEAETKPGVETEKEVIPLDNGIPNTDPVVESNEVETKSGVETENEQTDNSAGNTDTALQPKEADSNQMPGVETEKEVTLLDNGIPNTDPVVESNEVETKSGVETENEQTDDSAGNTDTALPPKEAESNQMPGVETENKQNEDSDLNTDPALQVNRAETKSDVEAEKEATPLDNGVPNTAAVLQQNEAETKPIVVTEEQNSEISGNHHNHEITVNQDMPPAIDALRTNGLSAGGDGGGGESNSPLSKPNLEETNPRTTPATGTRQNTIPWTFLVTRQIKDGIIRQMFTDFKTEHAEEPEDEQVTHPDVIIYHNATGIKLGARRIYVLDEEYFNISYVKAEPDGWSALIIKFKFIEKMLGHAKTSKKFPQDAGTRHTFEGIKEGHKMQIVVYDIVDPSKVIFEFQGIGDNYFYSINYTDPLADITVATLREKLLTSGFPTNIEITQALSTKCFTVWSANLKKITLTYSTNCSFSRLFQSIE
jgi:hypothetical protein